MDAADRQLLPGVVALVATVLWGGPVLTCLLGAAIGYTLWAWWHD